jgi:hypothetical protein
VTIRFPPGLWSVTDVILTVKISVIDLNEDISKAVGFVLV